MQHKLPKFLYADDSKLSRKKLLIRKERYRLLHELTPIMMLANILASPLLVLLMRNVIPHGTLFIWYAVLNVACLGTLFIYYYLRPYFKNFDTIPTSKVLYYSLPFIFGVIWGSTSYFFYTPDSLVHTAYLVIFLFGFASGSISALSAVWGSYAALAIPILLPFAIQQILHGDEENLYLGMVFLVFQAVLILISKVTNSFISKSIKTRYENIGLLDDLKKQTEEANKANRDKSRFLAAASHDLRQPIHSLSLLKTAIEPEVQTKRGKKILSHISAANDAMLNLLNSLLDISKLDAEVIEPHIQPVYLDDLVENLFSEFQPIAEENSLVLKRRHCPFYVATDPVLLATIIRNLLQNAIRYTPNGKVLLACRKRQGKIILQVWDTGNGIAKEDQELIFAEFQQLQNPERDQNKGLGLGLAICKRLSVMLGIPLKLSSVLGKGSVFSLEFEPLSEKAVKDFLDKKAQKANSTTMTRTNFKGCVVLVIDDNQSVLDAMKSLLDSWGCTVLTADGVEQTEAIAKSRSKSYAKNQANKVDAIIADYRLRNNTVGTDAIRVFNSISEQPAAAMLITGETSPERMKEVSSHGLPVLHKPIKAPQLKIVLARLLRLSS